MVKAMSDLGFFALEGNPLYVSGHCIAAVHYECILGARNREEDCEREQRILQQICCRFCLFILLDNIKEGLAARGGRSPNWVNHIYLCPSSFMCFLCLYFLHILCVALLHNI